MTPLRLDSACCRLANWRTDLPRQVDVAGLVGLLVDAGWSSRSRHPALKVLRHPQGHEMAWVLPTGRIQLRIDVGVAQGQRRSRARAIYDDLAACLDRLAAPARSAG